jgi:acetylornithine/N-succinyldiaminopimelate aminotransferase
MAGWRRLRAFIVTARDERLLVAGCGDNRVRLLPPLILSIDEADDFVRLIDATCVAMRTVQVEMA